MFGFVTVRIVEICIADVGKVLEESRCNIGGPLTSQPQIKLVVAFVSCSATDWRECMRLRKSKVLILAYERFKKMHTRCRQFQFGKRRENDWEARI